MKLKDKILMITGGAQGLGRATATHLAARGAQLALVDIDGGALEEATRLCCEAGATTRGYIADVGSEESVLSVFDQIERDFGGLHGLINNAGITREQTLVNVREGRIVGKMSLGDWQDVLHTNLTGTFLCGREAAARMIQSRTRGVIVNVSSIARTGAIGQTGYSATKAGVVAMTVAWARELAPHGIRTAAIAPGFFATESVMHAPPDARENMTSDIPMHRLGHPDEMAQSVAFVIENDYFSGRVLEIDGGLRC